VIASASHPGRDVGRTLAGLALWGVLAGGLAGCSPGGVAVEAHSGGQQPMNGVRWREARRSFAELRGKYRPDRPYTMNLALELSHPLTGSRLRARGAMAVSPRDGALRMILLGPGGTTALDLWICGQQWRFVLPAVGLRQRGNLGDGPGDARGLPVDFLRWWLLRPLEGRLLYAAVDQGGRRYLLRDGDDVVDVVAAADHGLTLERRSPSDRHRVHTDGPGCASVRYRQASTGVDMAIFCESIDSDRSPRPQAFVDPDDPHRACASDSGASP